MRKEGKIERKEDRGGRRRKKVMRKSRLEQRMDGGKEKHK